MSASRFRALTTDLTTLALVRRVVRVPAFQFALVVPTTAAVAIVTISAAVGMDHPAVNFGTVFTWVVWWGALLVSLVTVGRVWCLVCPLGAIAEWLQRLSPWWRARVSAGLDLRWPRRLRSMWLGTILFVAFVFLDSGYGIGNSPRMTAALVVVITLGAAWTSLVFERRTFCRYLCPLTAFLGLSSLVAAFELRRREPTVCARCRTKDCFRGNARRFGCPMLEFPGGGMDTNAACILCTECVRSCPEENIALRFRAPGRDLWTMRRSRTDIACAAAVIVGLTTIVPLMTIAFLPDVRAVLAQLLPAGDPPNDPPRLVALGALFVAGIGASGVLVLGAAALGSLATGIAPRTLFARYACVLMPIGLARYLADLLEHASRTWGALGEATRALALDFPWNRVVASGRVGVTHLLDPPAGYGIQVAMLVGGLGLTLYVAQRVAAHLVPERARAFALFVPVAGLALLFTLVSVWTIAAGL
jgi:4Fe-4S binding protein